MDCKKQKKISPHFTVSRESYMALARPPFLKKQTKKNGGNKTGSLLGTECELTRLHLMTKRQVLDDPLIT